MQTIFSLIYIHPTLQNVLSLPNLLNWQCEIQEIMASHRVIDFAADRSSPLSGSYRSDSPVFHSPRSLSPQDDAMPRENTEATEITPLATHENHFGTSAAGDEDERSMSLVFRGSSSSFELERVSVWRRIRDMAKKVKPWFFFLLGGTFAVLFAMKEVPETGMLVAISHTYPEYFKLDYRTDAVVTVAVSGPFVDEDEASSDHNLIVGLVSRNDTVTKLVKVENIGINCTAANKKDQKVISVKKTLKINKTDSVTHLMLALTLNMSYPIAISMQYNEEHMTLYNDQVVVALVILIGVYVLIIFELVHRTTAAMLGSLAALSFLSYIDRRPSLDTIVKWVEWETLFLLFGMMILVAVFAKTGFFDYVALKAYKLSRGHVWWLITLLCACTALISAVLDNVTVILLLTPVTVTLCQVLNLNPTPILIAEVVFSNIGGTATAIGDPPNVLLVSNLELQEASKEINFGGFIKHLIGGIFFCLVVAYLVLRLLYRNVKIVNDDPPIIEELRREAEIWKRSADRLPVFTAEEKTVKLLLIQKAMQLENSIRNMKQRPSREEAFERSLQELERKYIIRDKGLLLKSSLVICLVIVLFFIQSGETGLHLDIGWIAILGAILLILLADITHFEELMEQIEWTTLVFFSGLFILMRSLKELGLMDFLGHHTSTLIENLGHGCSPKSKLGIAVIVIVWVAALTSSFIDNIPFTTAMPVPDSQIYGASEERNTQQRAKNELRKSRGDCGEGAKGEPVRLSLTDHFTGYRGVLFDRTRQSLTLLIPKYVYFVR